MKWQKQNIQLSSVSKGKWKKMKTTFLMKNCILDTHSLNLPPGFRQNITRGISSDIKIRSVSNITYASSNHWKSLFMFLSWGIHWTADVSYSYFVNINTISITNTETSSSPLQPGVPALFLKAYEISPQNSKVLLWKALPKWLNLMELYNNTTRNSIEEFSVS